MAAFTSFLFFSGTSFCLVWPELVYPVRPSVQLCINAGRQQWAGWASVALGGGRWGVDTYCGCDPDTGTGQVSTRVLTVARLHWPATVHQSDIPVSCQVNSLTSATCVSSRAGPGRIGLTVTGVYLCLDTTYLSGTGCLSN